MSERLAAELAALEVAWPPTPDIAGAVLARLEEEPAPAPRRKPRRFRLAPALAWTAAALLAALGITMAASREGRSSPATRRTSAARRPPERRRLRASLATIVSSQGRRGSPLRKRCSARYALTKASWAASSASAASPVIRTAVRNAIS